MKRNTRVTKDDFTNQYENVYEMMVEAGIAEKVEEEIQYETGLTSKFWVTRPKYMKLVHQLDQ